MTNIRIGQAISSIYDAAVDEEKWGLALDSLVDALSARAAVLMVVTTDDPAPYHIHGLSQVFRDFLRSDAGQDYYHRLRPMEAAEAQALHRMPVGQLYSDDDLPTPATVLDQREDYRTLRQLCEVRRKIGMRLNDNRLWRDAVTVSFPAERDHAPAESIAAHRLVAPHMAKAVEVGRMFHELRRRYRAVLAAIDKVGVGLAIALPGGELIVANDEAERIFASGDGLSRSRSNHIVASVPEAAGAIAAMIEAAAGPSPAAPAEQCIAVPRRSGQPSYLVEVSPLADPDREISVELEGALVKIIDPCDPPDLNVGRFASAYDLTPAEEAVARLLLAGHGPATIAEIRATSPNTARNQVAAIMSKAGSHSRSDLIRLMVRLLPPVR